MLKFKVIIYLNKNMKSNNFQKILIGLIPTILVASIIIYNPNNLSVKRNSPQFNNIQEALNSFNSKLKDINIFPVETSTNPIESLKTEVKSEGIGNDTVKSGMEIRVNYRGWLAKDGSVFDESFKRGDEGFKFVAGTGNVIKGWQEGVIGMKQNEVRRIFIPSSQAYGELERTGIPANSDLIFDVELIEVIQK